MLQLIINLLATAGLLYVLALVLPGVRLKSYGWAVIVAVVYGVLNNFLTWLIDVVIFIPNLLSFGLFGLVINAFLLWGLVINVFLLWLTDKLVDDFEIESVKMTAIMAVLLTVGNSVMRRILF